jgi:hypothetical protein
MLKKSVLVVIMDCAPGPGTTPNHVGSADIVRWHNVAELLPDKPPAIATLCLCVTSPHLPRGV